MVVGSLNIDIVISLARMPETGETVFGDSLERHAGGKGLNQAVAAARLGARVDMIGAVGSDGSGEWLREVLRQEGIGADGLATMPGSSGTALIEVDGTGANRIVVVSGANALVTADQVTAALAGLSDVAVVLTQGEVPAEAATAALVAGRAMGAVTILNPAPVTDLPDVAFDNCDYLIPNEPEAAQLTGLPTATSVDATHAARVLVDRGAGCVIVTRSNRGSVWASTTSTGSCGAFNVRAIDTVGAGDAFCGGLAAAIAEGSDLSHALRWASATGALATTVSGAVPSLPTREAVEELVG